MLRVIKGEEPTFLGEYKRRANPKVWNDYDEITKGTLREYILDKEQQGLCPYCERVIDSIEEGHVEHFKPRIKYPHLFQDYNNLLVSCNDKSTCGSHKGGRFSDDLINPINEEPTDYLTYNMATGEVCEVDYDKRERVRCTIDLLNLNHRKLCETRKKLINMLLSCKNSKENFEAILANHKEEDKNFPELIKILEKFYQLSDTI